MAEFQQYLAILDSDPNDIQVLEAIQSALSTEEIVAAPDAQRALEQTRKSLHERGEIDTTLRLLDIEIDAVSDTGRQADLLIEKGQLYASDLLDDESAVACLRQALALRPDDPLVQETLDQMDMERENWRKFVQKNLDEARASTDRALTTHMYLSAAEYYGRYEPNADEFETYLRQALMVDAKNHKAALLLERRLRRAERWDELLSFLEQRVEVSGKKERVQALLSMAEVARDHLDKADVAETCMKKVLAMDPAHPRALRVLADLYEAAEDWSALVLLYTGALKARRSRGDDSEIGMLLQIAMLHWRRLNNMDGAEEYFRRIRKAQPAHPAALDFYRTYYPMRGEGAKLLQVLRQAQKSLLDRDAAERKRAISVEIADLAENALGNPEKAIDAWKSILRADPAAEDARAALKRLYRKTEKWNALLDIMKDEVERLPKDDVAGRVAGLMDIVAIYRDRLKLDVMVINTYASILKLDPHNRQALDDLAGKYEQLGRWNDLITVLSRKAELPELPVSERVEMLRNIARLWSERFGNFAQAIKPLEQLVELAPHDSAALSQLKEIYTRRRQWRALIGLLQREADQLPIEKRRDKLVEIARLAAERLGDNKLSIEFWNRILELPGVGAPEGNPGTGVHAAHDEDALKALVHLYEREKRYVALAEIYRRQRALARDDATAASVLERQGTLLADRLKAPALAAEAFQDLLTIRPRHSRALRTLRELYASAGNYEALEGLYANLGQWDELVESFHNIADRLDADQRDTRLTLLERSAAIAAQHFLKPDKIARAYERVLSVVPDHLEAARALVPIYEATQKWARLLSTYEILLKHARGDEDRLRLQIKIRDLCEKQLGSKALAFQWTAKAYRLDPGRSDLLADLQRLGAEADQWEQVASILDARLHADDPDEDEKLGLLRDLGKIAAVRLHQPERARTYQREVLELAPDDPEAMSALEEIATQLSDWPDLLAVYRRRVDLAEDDADKVDLLFKIAYIEEERLAAFDGAAATYTAILDLQPDSHRAMRALAKIQEARGDWGGLAEALQRELAHTADTDAKVALLIRIGSLHEDNLDQPEAALAAYCDALALAPGRTQIHTALERFLGGPADGDAAADAHTIPDDKRIEVAALLLPVYEQSEDPARIARAIEVLRGSAEGQQALAYDRRLRMLYGERLSDPERAYDAGLRVLEETPEDSDNRAALLRYAEALDKDADLAAQFAQLLAQDRPVDAGARRVLAMELAGIYQERLDDPDQAEGAWRAVLDLSADTGKGDKPAYEALDRIYRTAGRWRELRDLLVRREANTLYSEERKQIVLAICELEEGVLDNVEGAIAAYQRVLEIDPTLLQAYRALERLYQQTERYAELEELFGREFDYVDDDARIELSYRRAELRAHRLDDPQGAVSVLEEVVSLNPEHSKARALLEELLDVVDLRLRVSRVLEPLYERDGLWEPLCRVLRAQREFASSAYEAADLLGRVATVQEEDMGQPEVGFATWVEILGILPADDRARESLGRLGQALDRWQEVAAAYERALDDCDPADIALRAELLQELAEIYDQRLVDVDQAISAYRRLLELDPSNPDTVRIASTALDRLYEAQARWNDLIDIIRRQVDWADSLDDRKRLLARIATVHESKLDDMDAAIATWREVVAEDPEDIGALEALERLYQSERRSSDLVDTLRRRVELVADPEARKAYLRRIAEILENQLGDASEAITAHLEVLDYLPDDRDTLVELSRMYRSQERYPDLLDIVERRLALSEAAAERIALMCEVGSLLHSQLHREAEALERYAEVLDIDPDNADALAAIESMVSDPDLLMRAAEILQPIYTINGSHDKLAALLVRVADETVDLREQLRALGAVARLREERLQDKKGAFAVAVRAVRAAVAEPELPELVNEVERLAAELDQQGDLITLYQEIAPDVLDGDLRRRLQLDIADLARALRADLDLSREYYQRVLDDQPDDRRALEALESIYRQTEQYDRLHDILIRKAELAGDDLDRQAEALAEAARLCAEKLGRPEDAIVAWEQVLEITPENKEAVEALEDLYEGSERYHDLIDLLERRLGYAFAVEEAVALRFRLGELHEHKLHDPEGAVENYSAALGGDPTHTSAITALERFLDDPGTRNAAADVLEPIYVAQQEWLKLARIYEIKLESTDDAGERLEITRYIARLYEEQLEDLEGAARWYGRVFREDPSDTGVRDQLHRLALLLNNWGDLANVYQEYLDDEMGDSEDVAMVARTLGDICNDRLDEVERGQAAYRRVLQIYPDDMEVFVRLEEMLTRGERWYALVDVYEDAITSTGDNGRRKDLLARMAQVHEHHLHDLDQAINAYRSVRDIDPDDPRAIGELERLYQEGNQWFELSELLTERIGRLDQQGGPREPLVELRIRLAEIMEQHLEDVASAIDQYQLVLESESGWQTALPPLERLVRDEDYRERIAEMLEPVYRTNDWWQKLVVILDTQVQYVDDPARRVVMLREIAQLHETRGGDQYLALDALSRAWRENVHDSDVYDELSALAAKLSAWDTLVDTLQQGVDNEYDTDLVISVWTRIAEIHERKRLDNTSAIAAWRRVLEIRDDDPAALPALDRLLASEGRYVELVEVVERRAQLADDDGTRLVLLHRIAALLEEELDQPAEAVVAYKNVLSADETDVRALDSLERLYRREQDWNELVGVLARKIELGQDADERRNLRFAAAAIYDRELADPYEAISLYRAVLDSEMDAPDNATALAELDALYQREAMWLELLEILDRRIAIESDPEPRAELAYRAAQVVEKELFETDQAVDRYAALLIYAPEHVGARTALDAMTRGDDISEPAAEVLEQLYRADNAFDDLADLFERRLAVPNPDLDLRKAQYGALGQVYEDLQRDLDQAFAVWARALGEFPDDQNIQAQLERLAALRGAWEELVVLLEERLAEILDAELEYTYATKLANLYEEALGDLDGAAAKYRQALDVAADQREALSALDRIFHRAGRYSELADILAREAEASADEAEQCQFLFRLGDLREVSLDDIPGAVSAYRDVLERMPQHTAARGALERLLLTVEDVRAEVISILEPLYDEEGDYARLADLLAAKLGTTSDHFDRAQIYSRIAELAERRLGDPVRALDATGGWLAEDPRSERALAELERLGSEVDRWGEVAARLLGIIESADSEDVQRTLLVKLGNIQLDRLQNPEAAENAFRRCLDLEPEAIDALEALQRIYRGRGDRAQTAGILERLGELSYEAGSKRNYLVEVADLRTSLGELDAAIESWKEVLTLDDGDREALDKLALIYEQRESWHELIDVLSQASRFAVDSDEERTLRTRIASIYTDTMEDLDAAVDAWQSVLDVAPEATDALLALESIFTRRKDWLAVQDVLMRRLTLVDDPPDRILILRRLATLAVDERDAVDDAIGYLYQVLDIDNAHLETYTDLEKVLAQTERWHDLVELCERAAELHRSQGKTQEEIQALARAADVWEGALENPDAAGEILETILAREPQYVPALTRLAKIYESNGDWQRCGEILQQALSLGPSGREAAELYFRMGEVVRQRDGDTDEAMQHWQRALDADGDYMPVVCAVEEVAREQGNWAMVADMVSRREAAETDRARKLELVLQLADLYGKKLAQPERVIPYLEQAAELAPDDVRVQEPLADLYFAAGQHAQAVPIYQRLAEAARKGRKMKAVAVYRQRLGGIFEAQGDTDAALTAYEEAFRVNPTDVATMAGLGRIYLARQLWEKARRVYRSMVLQNLDPDMGITKAEVYYHLGRIHLELDEPRKAKGMFQRGLELEPKNEQLLQALQSIG